MKNLSIKVKYSAPMAVMIIALLTLIASNTWLTSKLESDLEDIAGSFLKANNLVLNADRDLYQARLAELLYISTRDNRSAYMSDYQENAQQAKDRFEEYLSIMQDYPAITKELQGFKTSYESWFQAVAKNLELGASVDDFHETEEQFQSLRNLYDRAGEMAFAKSEAVRARSIAKIDSQKKFSWVLAILVIAGSVLATYISQKKLVERIQELSDGIKEITSGEGDLNREIVVKHKDEIGQLSLAFNDFVKSLRGLIFQFSQDVVYLNECSNLLGQSSTKSSEVVTNQSKSVETIVSSIHQMNIATQEMAKNAQHTAMETEDVLKQSRLGVINIAQAVQQIQALYATIETASSGARQLADQSKNISSVLDVIRGIAEQTNLLALNAAIEAARAGEQGRGFAVVADEVRSLASKTQESTDSIQKMIEGVQTGVANVVNQIEDGFAKVSSSVELTSSIESTLNETQGLIAKIKDMSVQTAAATEEQSAVTEGINRNLHELSHQTTVTSEISNDTQASAQKVGEIAARIYAGVNKFKVS